jgi:radical SAM-linked protein
MQRLRIRFSRGEEVKFISHLDVMRFWQRALKRANIPLAYSQGFTPHPKISLAAPLPVGVTSEAELMDAWLRLWMPPQSFIMRIKKQLPLGFEVSDVWEVGLNVPSLQSSLSFAEYQVEVETERAEQEIAASILSLLQAKELPWYHARDSKLRFYDLRALVDDLWLIGYHDSRCILGMRLRCNTNGRPEQVTAALGFPQSPESIHRTKLILKTFNHHPNLDRTRSAGACPPHVP